MGLTIRRATSADAAQWLALVHETLGPSYPVKSLYDPAWITAELDGKTGQETWVADAGGKLMGSVTFLSDAKGASPVANLARNLFRPASASDGSAAQLLKKIDTLVDQSKKPAVVRIPATDKLQQDLFEKAGYVCVGFQPLKHMLEQRVSVLFYVRGADALRVQRPPFSDSLPQSSRLGVEALTKLGISPGEPFRDGATGYPLQFELMVQEVAADEYARARELAESCGTPMEVSGRFNLGFGLMRMPENPKARMLLAGQDRGGVSGLTFYCDEQDRCVRVIDAFCSDDLSMGALLAHTVRLAQDQLGVIYTEIDILASAPRLLKSAEQLGFIPVAYLPAFHSSERRLSDVVKLVKLNLPYVLDSGEFTDHARSVVKIIDGWFEEQKLGLPVMHLLRPLVMFSGFGDGELRKVARLCSQKLYRQNERIFARGESGDEAYLVLRGKINVHLELDAPPVTQLGDGKLFGELAFLGGAPRAAHAIAAQPTILLVIKRETLTELTRREPILGLALMGNLARDLAQKLRALHEELAAPRKSPARAKEAA